MSLKKLKKIRTNFEPILAECLRIILNAEFGSFTVETVIRAGSHGTYWEDAARTLDEYHRQVNGEIPILFDDQVVFQFLKTVEHANESQITKACHMTLERTQDSVVRLIRNRHIEVVPGKRAYRKVKP